MKRIRFIRTENGVMIGEAFIYVLFDNVFPIIAPEVESGPCIIKIYCSGAQHYNEEVFDAMCRFSTAVKNLVFIIIFYPHNHGILIQPHKVKGNNMHKRTMNNTNSPFFSFNPDDPRHLVFSNEIECSPFHPTEHVNTIIRSHGLLSGSDGHITVKNWLQILQAAWKNSGTKRRRKEPEKENDFWQMNFLANHISVHNLN